MGISFSLATHLLGLMWSVLGVMCGGDLSEVIGGEIAKLGWFKSLR